MAAILCFDFDDTITLENTARQVFERFAKPEWRGFEAEYQAGRQLATYVEACRALGKEPGITAVRRDIYVGARAGITPEFGVSARIYYRSIDYVVRPDDDYLEGQVIADYTVSEHLTISGAVIVRNNESDMVGGDFENTVVRLAAHLRY